jgi:hypothetical protein
MVEDLENLQAIAHKISKTLEKEKISYTLILHDQKTGRVFSLGGVSGADVEEKRKAYERMIYVMILTLVGNVIRDLQSGEKDLVTIAFKKFIEDSKDKPLSYIG